MTDDVVEDLSTWQVIGVTCEMPDPQRGADVRIRVRSTVHGGERTLTLGGVTPESAFGHFPLFNASLLVLDTSARGWESARRFEITDTDDDGPYLYAAAFDDE